MRRKEKKIENNLGVPQWGGVLERGRQNLKFLYTSARHKKFSE